MFPVTENNIFKHEHLSSVEPNKVDLPTSFTSVVLRIAREQLLERETLDERIGDESGPFNSTHAAN